MTRRAEDVTIVLEAGDVVSDPVIGESIACDGVCLTVVKAERGALTFDVSVETIKRSTFSDISNGRKLNLERATRLGDRLGGHLVSGHIDCVGKVAKVVNVGSGYEVTIQLPEESEKYVIEKGSIAIDGISLTVAKKEERSVTIAVIPHTFKETTLGEKRVGKFVNVECDMIAKYVENFVKPTDTNKSGGGLTESFLRERGF